QWPEDGPELLWSDDGVGHGYAAPVVTKDKIFINGEIDSIAHLFAFDLDGNLLWKTPMGKEFFGSGFSSTYPGARSTPTVLGDLVYTVSGKGHIICCDVSSGNLKWEVDMVNDLDGYQPYFGVSESLALDENHVYCYPSGSFNNIVALDRFTGEPVWATPAMKDTSSFCSPIFIDLPDRKIMVTMSHYYLLGIDTDNGQFLWSYNIKGYEAEGDHCNTPIYYDGHIYQVIGDRYSQGTVKLKLASDGSSVSEVWNNDKVKNNFDGFIMHNNLLFATVRGNYLKVMELDKGKVVDSLKIANGALIFSDDKFFCYGRNGEVSLVNYIDGKFEIGGSFKVNLGSKHHFSHPVLANGVMYIRHGDVLMAYKVK
ncbi:PQQ-binding-like beta-propeller repeat protein, partial [Bacteroidota bacterium]